MIRPAINTEYLAHRLIGTPLELPIRRLRDFSNLRDRLQHPELHDIHAEPLRVEAVMQRLIRNPMNCVDVGCHLGGLLQLMVKFSPQGRHLGFEPAPHKVEWLRQKYPQVTFHQCALSDRTGETEFFLARTSALSATIPDSTQPEMIDRFIVPCQRLDDLVPPDRSIDFLKIGAPTGELAILHGSTQTLQRCHPIILFVCTKSGLEALQTPPQAVYDFLVHQHGYAIFLPQDWLGDRAPLSLEQFAQALEYPFQAFRFLAMPQHHTTS